MHRARVAVLRGGPSNEYEVSLKTGADILKHLSGAGFLPTDIFVDKEGVWHLHGAPVNPQKVSLSADVFVNALHGEYGEDGRVQNLLDRLSAKYTGSGALSSALSMNKALSKKVFEGTGLKVPHSFVIDVGDQLERDIVYAFQNVPRPWVVKPAFGGSSLGISVTDSMEGLRDAVSDAFEHFPKIIVEEHVSGKDASCGVIENFRGRRHHPLMPVEVCRPSGSRFFDYDAKYSGESTHFCPGNFTREEKEEIERAAVEAHKALGLRHYSRSDFIVGPRGVYLLETNSLPDLTDESLFLKSFVAGGGTAGEFLEHLVGLALQRR